MSTLPSNPFAMGFLVPTAGTPKSLLTLAQTNFPGLVAAQKAAAGVWPAKAYHLQFFVPGANVWPAFAAGNIGSIYVGGPNLQKASPGKGVIMILPPTGTKQVGFYEWLHPAPNNIFNLENVFLDCDTQTDGVFVTAWVM